MIVTEAIFVQPDAQLLTVDATVNGAVTVGDAPPPTPTPSPSPTITPGGPTLTPTPTPSETSSPTQTMSPTPTPTFTPTPGPASVFVQPPFQSVEDGAIVSVDVGVSGAFDLGAYELNLAFDPAILSFQAATNGSFLSSTGRAVSCRAPVIGVGTVRLTCVTFGDSPDGVYGAGLLANFSFEALVPGTTPIDLNNTKLVDIRALGQAIDLESDGMIDVLPRPTSTPTHTPTVTLTSTETQTPTETPVATDTPTPSATITPGGPTLTPSPTSQPTETPTPTPIPSDTPTPTITATESPTATSTPTPLPLAIRVRPPVQTVPLGFAFPVEIAVDEVSNLGAFELRLIYDPSVLDFVSAAPGPFLASSGRTTNCLAPARDFDSVRLTCVTLGSEPPGASGSGLLAVFTFTATQQGASAAVLADVTLLTPSAEVIAGALLGNGVVFADASAPTFTPTTTAAATNTAAPTVTPGGATFTFTPTPTAGSATPTPVPAVVAISPSSQQAALGGTVAVTVTASNVTNLGAYEWTVRYDPAVLTFVSVSNAPFLGSTGRTVFCPPVILGIGTVRFGCATAGTSPPGPSGTGTLSTLLFSTVALGSSALTFDAVSLADPLGNTLPAAGVGGAVDVVQATPTATTTPLASIGQLGGRSGHTLALRPEWSLLAVRKDDQDIWIMGRDL